MSRGFSAAAVNGDIPQGQRERTTIARREGVFDILASTDVSACRLDVQRISHVLSYDIPHDTEFYVHRIGRTGRAGRSGKALLFVSLGGLPYSSRSKRLLGKHLPRSNCLPLNMSMHRG